MPKLSLDEIHSRIRDLPGWALEADALVRDFKFADFAAALRFVNQIGALAEAANHHPNIDIRYNRVRLALRSHDVGEITQRDLKLARQISALPGDAGSAA